MDENMTRREILGASVIPWLASGLLGVDTAWAADEPKNEGKAFFPRHQPKPLPFKPAKLNGLSERLIVSHWENNYGGAVKALNALEAKLGELAKDKDTSPGIYASYKREQQLKLGSLILHEKYFGNLGGNGKVEGEIKTAITSSFGDLSAWEAEFRKTAQGLSGGSGWVVLAYDLHLNRLENYWSWDHLHNLPSSIPVVVLDMYEHAYHMDYGAQAAKYIDAFMSNVNWEEANRRYVSLRKVASGVVS